MVAQESITAPGVIAAAAPSSPNRADSVCAALTTTQRTTSAPVAASAGVLAEFPPRAANRVTVSTFRSYPVTEKPSRSSEDAIPDPIDPRPITLTFNGAPFCMTFLDLYDVSAGWHGFW